MRDSGWYPATIKMEHEAAQSTNLKQYGACGDVPVLQVIGDSYPFTPELSWYKMQEEFGQRIGVCVVHDA